MSLRRVRWSTTSVLPSRAIAVRSSPHAARRLAPPSAPRLPRLGAGAVLERRAVRTLGARRSPAERTRRGRDRVGRGLADRRAARCARRRRLPRAPQQVVPARTMAGLARGPHAVGAVRTTASSLPRHIRSAATSGLSTPSTARCARTPRTPDLRIDLGQVQEQAGLHLDAAATYADIIAVESWFDGRLWRRLRRILSDGTTGRPPARLNGKRNGRDALLIARTSGDRLGRRPAP